MTKSFRKAGASQPLRSSGAKSRLMNWHVAQTTVSVATATSALLAGTRLKA